MARHGRFTTKRKELCEVEILRGRKHVQGFYMVRDVFYQHCHTYSMTDWEQVTPIFAEKDQKDVA